MSKNVEFDVPKSWENRDEVVKLTGDGSITPDTHKWEKTTLSKEFDSNSGNMGEAKILSAEAIFRTEYQYQENQISKVTRFGINIKNESVIKELEWLKSKKEQALTVKSDLQALKKDAEKITVTVLEQTLFDGAIEHLNRTEDKVVLIDVIDRSSNEGIHSAVLCKQDTDFFLIDPNNPSFTAFLLSHKKDLFISNDKNKTIYKYNSTKLKTGPLPENARDCIDIAVKLAFSLNNSKEKFELSEGVISKDKLGLHSAIEDITNCQKVSKLLPKEMEPLAFRVKQSSNIVESQKSSLYLKIYEKLVNVLDTLNPLNLKSLKEPIKIMQQSCDKIKDCIKKNVTPTEYDNLLLAINQQLATAFKTGECLPEVKLLAETFDQEIQYIENQYE